MSDIKNIAHIEDELKTSYLDYAMSVIVGRALPDVRDGLKPVHRRILFTMYDNGIHYNRPYVKSARVVGDVMGKLHPHGDAAIYETLVRMAQPFSMRYMVVDGQGNFGSVDGDPPAAMRYTEARLARVADEVLSDIGKETVDWRPSYDEKQLEPVVLPAAVPMLLMNGSEGIAVGMATKVPPHNIRELLDGLIALAKDPSLGLRELMVHIPGPDFPTGGFIYGRHGIHEAYMTGRGRVLMRARMDTEENEKTGRLSIVITEIPYQVNKTRLIEEIADGVRNKRIEGISDLRDESDKDGMRIVIELKREAVPSVVTNQLYKMTSCSTTFGVNMLALVGGRPRTLGLRDILTEFLAFRREVVTRRCIFEKRQAEERIHILNGLIIALDHIDAIISIIRGSQTQDQARERMIASYELSLVQAQAILDMRLARLTGLERQKIEEEQAQLAETIARLAAILADENLLTQVIIDEFEKLRERYGDARRTEILDEEGEFAVEDLIADEDMVVTVTHQGYIKRNSLDQYRAQGRGGKGVIGMEPKEGDFVEQLYVASMHQYFLVFTSHGKLYWLKVFQIPPGARAARGRPIVNLLTLTGMDEKVVTVLPVREFAEGQYVVMITRRGIVKKTDLMAFSNVRQAGIIALSIDDGDDLVFAGLTDGKHDIMIATREGQSIRFDENDVRPMGRNARGVRGINLAAGDEVVAATVVEDNRSVLTVCERGYGKRTALEEYRRQSRGGRGIITIRTTERNGKVVAVRQADDGEQLIMITELGKIIRLRVDTLRIIGRSTQGVRLFDLAASDRVVAVSPLPEGDDEDLEATEEATPEVTSAADVEPVDEPEDDEPAPDDDDATPDDDEATPDDDAGNEGNGTPDDEG